MALSGFQFKHALADDRFSFYLQSSALEAVSGERRQTHTAVSWELACKCSEHGKRGIVVDDNVGSMASEPDLLRLHNPLSSQM
jgi:hypothetical protein